MEQEFCTAVFWRGGEKIDLHGLEPEAVRYLSVTGERKVDVSFLQAYPNLEELLLMEKCEGVEVLSELKQLRHLTLWLSAPVFWENIHLPKLRYLHLRGEKNGDVTPLLSGITFLHLEEMRKIEDISPLLMPADHLQKLYLQSLPAVQTLPNLGQFQNLYAMKLYELHKLNDLTALSHSNLHYFAASLIADKMSAGQLAESVMEIPRLKGAALELVDRSRRRYGQIQKAFAAAGKSPLLCEEISDLRVWMSL